MAFYTADHVFDLIGNYLPLPGLGKTQGIAAKLR